MRSTLCITSELTFLMTQHFSCINMHYESSFTKKFKVGKKQLVDFYAQPSPRTVRARSQAFEDD